MGQGKDSPAGEKAGHRQLSCELAGCMAVGIGCESNGADGKRQACCADSHARVGSDRGSHHRTQYFLLPGWHTAQACCRQGKTEVHGRMGELRWTNPVTLGRGAVENSTEGEH